MANILAQEQGALDLFDILNMADGILTIDEIKKLFMERFDNCETVGDILNVSYPADLERLLVNIGRRTNESRNSRNSASRALLDLADAITGCSTVITEKRRRLI